MSSMTVTQDNPEEVTVNESPPSPAPIARTPLDRAVVLSLKIRAWGAGRRANKEAIQTGETNKDFLTLGKKLLISPELAAINKFDLITRAAIKARSMAFPLREGFAFINKTIVTKTIRLLEERKVQREELVRAFIEDSYLIQKNTAQVELGPSQYRETDYPTVGELRKLFSMDWNFLELGTPQSLKEYDVEAYEVEREKLAEQMKNAGEEIMAALRTEVYKRISHLVERITPTTDGKKKKFDASTVTKLQDLFDFFDVKNIMDDKDLANVVAKAREILTGVDAPALKTNEGLRDAVRTKLEEVTNDLDSLMKAAGTRRISFLEDE